MDGPLRTVEVKKSDVLYYVGLFTPPSPTRVEEASVVCCHNSFHSKVLFLIQHNKMKVRIDFFTLVSCQ